MNTLIDVAVADGHFKTLAAALTATGLIDTLKGAGLFTVFAPTDDAFAKLPPGTVDGLLKVSTQGGVKLNGNVHVTKTDVAASNGLIHVIDAVLMPPA